MIYLVDAQNVSEPLSINITVKGEEPAWDVDPSLYQYSMSVFGQLRINGVFSMDENDILAAFSGNTCVGTAKVTYNAPTDMYYVLLTVYSNNRTDDQQLTFRMYDASTGVIYGATPSQTVTFSNNKVYGTPMNPVIFDGNELYFNNMELKQGWNWISFNLLNDDFKNINTALNGAKWLNGEQIKNLKYSATYSGSKNCWNVGGGLKELDNLQMPRHFTGWPAAALPES